MESATSDDRPPEHESVPPPPSRDSMTLGVAAGVGLATAVTLAVRFVLDPDSTLGKVFSLVSVLALPTLMGLVTVLVGDRGGTWSRMRSFFLPLVPALLLIAIAWPLYGWSIVIIGILLPFWLPFLGIGGLIGRESRQNAASRARAAARSRRAEPRPLVSNRRT